MSQLLSTLALFALIGWLFIVARRTASTSRRVRSRMIAAALSTLIVVPVIGYWLTRQVPDTPGSPAALVGVTLIWLLGGVFLLFAVPALIGALVAKPMTEEEA
jgi:cytochrome bd-type quinol oxidase subunit 2